MLEPIYSEVESIPKELVKKSHVGVRLVAVKDTYVESMASRATNYVNTVKAMFALIEK